MRIALLNNEGLVVNIIKVDDSFDEDTWNGFKVSKNLNAMIGDMVLSDDSIVKPIPEDKTLKLDDYKTQKKNNIDKAAETQRLLYITSGIGQTLVYQEKSDEASDYIAAGEPSDLMSYPFIRAEINATGKTSSDAANDILAAQANWMTKASFIEEYRIKGKIDIEAATNFAEVDAIANSTMVNIQGV